MNKAFFPLTVAVALTSPFAAYADTILYGEAKVSVDYTDNNRDPAAYWDVVNNGSKLGFKGSEDLGGGLSAFYQYEFSVDMTEGGNFDGLNQKFVGIKGGFGAVTLGTQDTPYWKVLNVVDIFNSGKMFNGTIYLGGSLTPETDDNGALGTLVNSVDYQTPIIHGFSAEALLVMDGRINAAEGYSNGVDIWTINLKYSQGPYFAGLTYIKLDGESNAAFGDNRTVNLNLDNWGLGLGYKAEQWLVGAIYEQGSFTDVNFDRQVRVNGLPLVTGDDAQSWLLVGQYTMGNNVVRAAYGQTNTGIDGEDTIDNYRLGYQYNFSKRTLLWAEYLGRDADVPLYGDQNVVSIGTKVLF
ncbi:MAG: porin [Candidatus Contendobacter sp.]|nr:porin [Candidatus Contendobacter sp.]